MRGLLICMMRQLDKVEVFKLQQREEHALHAMYDVETGTPVLADDQWCHLRVGATALFILQLAQVQVLTCFTCFTCFTLTLVCLSVCLSICLSIHCFYLSITCFYFSLSLALSLDSFFLSFASFFYSLL